MDIVPLTLILCMLHGATALAAFGEQKSFRWSSKVFQMTEEFQFVPGKLSAASHPMSSLRSLDIASFPQDITNQAAGMDHLATPHFVKVDILDSADRPTVSEITMRALANSGNIPFAKVTYTSPSEESLDSGESLLKIYGMAYAMDGLDSTNLSLVYPVPIDEGTISVKFDLPTVSFGSVLIRSISETFHVINFIETQNMGYVEFLTLNRNGWLPEMYAGARLMTISLTENLFLTSTDEFKTIRIQEISTTEGNSGACPDALFAAVSFQQRILHLRKAGPILSRPINGNWESLYNSVRFDNNTMCLIRATLLPPSCSKELLAVSDGRTIYIAQKRGESRLKMEELVSADGVTVCEAASLAEESCIVVDHAFDTFSCCRLFVLLQNTLRSCYILFEYEGLFSFGKWNKLTTMFNILPSLDDESDRMVFLSSDEQYTGMQFRINGINTLNHPDGTVYIWGDALLVYDIRSGILAWNPAFLLTNNSAEPDLAIQFNSANKKGTYSILTKHGGLWIGTAFPFEKHYSQLIELVLAPTSKNYLAVFFDSLDMLYGLTYTNSSGYSFMREKIKLNDKLSTNGCSRVYDCPRLFLRCRADYSAVHINHTAYSRTRHFLIKPPLLMPKAQKKSLVVHNKKSFFTYLTVIERFFRGEKISKSKWWFVDESNQNGEWWYTQDSRLEEYRKYLAAADLLPNDPMVYLSKKQFLHETIQPSGEYESWDISYCSLPDVIYLDKNEEFCFNVSIEHSFSATLLDFESLRLVVISSDNTVLDVTTIRHQEPFNVLYEVILTGQQMLHMPPGRLLTSVSVAFYPWNPPANIANSNTTCCSGISQGTAFEQNMLVKVGCPPARRLKFDPQRSLDILFSRGKTDDFECLYDSPDSVPCFTTSEFAAAFYVEDLVTGKRSPFEGNYTLQVVAGGTGYLENVREYDEEEIKSVNYRPGDSKSLLSLIWSVLLESSSDGMRDEETGRLIFNAKDPASIVLECRLDSPCGNIPLGTSNPGEFYLEIEASNKGVDSSTNCDYTMRFMIHLIGIELSQRVHLLIMLITLSILFLLTVMYYIYNFRGGYHALRRLMKMEEKGTEDSDGESEFAATYPISLEAVHRRLTITKLSNTALHGDGVRKPSLLTQNLLQDVERGRKRSSLRVYGVFNTGSNTSKVSNRTLNG